MKRNTFTELANTMKYGGGEEVLYTYNFFPELPFKTVSGDVTKNTIKGIYI